MELLCNFVTGKIEAMTNTDSRFLNYLASPLYTEVSLKKSVKSLCYVLFNKQLFYYEKANTCCS